MKYASNLLIVMRSELQSEVYRSIRLPLHPHNQRSRLPGASSKRIRMLRGSVTTRSVRLSLPFRPSLTQYTDAITPSGRASNAARRNQNGESPWAALSVGQNLPRKIEHWKSGLVGTCTEACAERAAAAAGSQLHLCIYHCPIGCERMRQQLPIATSDV